MKVLVRLLPPEITEQELLATVPEAHLAKVSWWRFEEGKRFKGEARPSINARCYFRFDAEESAEEFIKEYHGHQFVDAQGETFRAVTCWAPYQKVPRQKSQKDPRDGTIAEDSTYKEFLERLSNPQAAFEAPPNPVASLKPAEPGDTPLLRYMKERSKERRSRLERRERERRRWRESLDQIAEEPKRHKWQCSECHTTKNLEEDPDNRGTFYCTYCWEQWESKQPAQDSWQAEPKKKKKKKKGKEEEEYWEEEQSYSEPSSKSKRHKEKTWDENWEEPWEEGDKSTSSSRHRESRGKKEKKWREAGGEAEEPKKPKYSCDECSTTKNLEEDPDNRGKFYCQSCWEKWESKPKRKR